MSKQRRIALSRPTLARTQAIQKHPTLRKAPQQHDPAVADPQQQLLEPN
jgi:hypothetical protein